MPIEPASARAQLAALAPSIERFIEDRKAAYPDRTRGLQVLPKDVKHLYAIYRPILVQLRSEKPDLFGGLPERAPSTDFDPERRRVMVEDLQALLRDVRHCLDLLPAPGVQVALTVTREGVFFAGQRTDAMKLVLDIVALARTKLEVIDGYLDLGTLSLLTKEPKLHVEVIRKPVDHATAQAIAILAKGKKLQIRTSDAFHDRFICVDGRDFYHFGASIKDAGARGFMFSRVEEPAVIKALRDEWTRVWNSATVVV
jgi:hypothetical protein